MGKKKIDVYRTGIYLRLSQGDEDIDGWEKQESNSISNQRLLLEGFIDAHYLAEYVLSRALAACGACTFGEAYSDEYTTSREVQLLRVHCTQSKHGLNTGFMGRMHELWIGGGVNGKNEASI